MGSELTNQEVAEVYRDYGHLLLRRCRLLLRDPGLAEDALQEAFIKVMRYGAELRRVEARLRWLYRVVDRCCFDLMKRRGRLAEVDAPVELIGPHPAIQLELRDAALRLLHRLGDRDRTLAVMAFVDGMSQEAIAGETGWSRQTVNKRLQAIRKRADRLTGGKRG
jgi:RNA polymerase sigma factor (sigma-70 family)